MSEKNPQKSVLTDDAAHSSQLETRLAPYFRGAFKGEVSPVFYFRGLYHNKFGDEFYAYVTIQMFFNENLRPSFLVACFNDTSQTGSGKDKLDGLRTTSPCPSSSCSSPSSFDTDEPMARLGSFEGSTIYNMEQAQREQLQQMKEKEKEKEQGKGKENGPQHYHYHHHNYIPSSVPSEAISLMDDLWPSEGDIPSLFDPGEEM